MRIAVFGLGYVGSVTAACLAARGHDVVGVDISPRKVELIAGGGTPVLEPGLAPLIAEQVQAGRLDVRSNYFYVRVQVAQDDVELSTDALVARDKTTGLPTTLWRRPRY